MRTIRNSWVRLILLAMAFASAPAYSSVPFLVFDLAGGAALPGNFLVGKHGGVYDWLNSYTNLGWNPRADGAIDARFGLPMAGNGVSKILEGMLSVMSTEAQAGLRMGSLLTWSMDDSRSNQLSALTLVSRAGNVGTAIPVGVGMYPTPSGGYSSGPLNDASLRPLHVQSLRSLTSASDQVVDPRREYAVSDLYRLSENTSEFDRSVIIGAIVANVIQGRTGPGAITITGCDYTDETQTTGDTKDLEIGIEIGRAVELARRYRRPLFFQIITDGGMYARSGTRQWMADDGSKSMTVIGYYSPTGPVQYREEGRVQVGAYTDDQRVDMDTIIGGAPPLAAYATLVNYLGVINELSRFREIAPDLFQWSQFDRVRIFARPTGGR
jgi:hypothetical protein